MLVKVCCILSVAEARLALDLGAEMLGLVSEMPSGPGVIRLPEIAHIVRSLPQKTKTVLLTSKQTAPEILTQHQITKTWGLQLVADVSPADLKILRKRLPLVKLIQVIHVENHGAISRAHELSNLVDFLLLDSGRPSAQTKILGGTGQTHDWRISAEICRQSVLPVLLAGGLNAQNVPEALRIVQPHGLDVCSGIRTSDTLDANKLAEFITAVQQADTNLSTGKS